MQFLQPAHRLRFTTGSGHRGNRPLFLLGLHRIEGAGNSPLVSEGAILHTVAACVIGFALIAFANNRAARRLQKQIDHLNSLKDRRDSVDRQD